MNEQIPAATDLSIERILAPLVDVFPGGSSSDRVKIYADLIRPEGFTLPDLRNGIGRLIHVWDNTKFPPFAKLMACCNEARELRLKVERSEALINDPKREKCRLSPEQWAVAIAEIRDFRLDFFPPAQPDISTDKEARRKHLGIVPLTQAEIEMLQRKKRERMRDRQAKAREKAPPQSEDGFDEDF